MIQPSLLTGRSLISVGYKNLCKFSQMLHVHYLIGISQLAFGLAQKITLSGIQVMLSDGFIVVSQFDLGCNAISVAIINKT